MATQWSLKVKILSIDSSSVRGKTKWEAGDNVQLQIEPHATVNMVLQRIALIVSAHPKHQTLSFPEGAALEDIIKLEDIEGLTNGGTIFVDIKVPPMAVVPDVVVSDDEGLYAGAGEEVEAPALPAADVCSKELSDEDMDKQGELKQQAQDALEDGDASKALEKLTEAMLLGNVSAMMLAKRAEMLIKQKRYKAAVADATLALQLNPDSAKAYRARGRARRFIGDYDGSSADLNQGQAIDYDDGVADLHSYVKKRVAKMQLKVKQDAQKAAVAEKAADIAKAAADKEA